MSDIKLFTIKDKKANELHSASVSLEKSLQDLIEQNLEIFLGVQFLASEYSTGKQHRGRIDTLGIDENSCPVIIEYKKATNENVINQGLFYLDWLMDHKSEFQWLVMEKFGKERANEVEWKSPRLICIAGDYTNYDQHAVLQIPRNIELVRYRKYGDDFVLFELVNAVVADLVIQESPVTNPPKKSGSASKTVGYYYEQSSQELKDLYELLKAYVMALGDDVQLKICKNYFAFKRIKNFACVEIHPQNAVILVYLKLNPDEINLDALGKDFARNVRNIGHFATGDLEIKLRTNDDLSKAIPLIEKSYEVS